MTSSTAEATGTVATCHVRLLPEDRACKVGVGTSLQEALARLDVPVTAPCGGEGTCGKCRVQVSAANPPDIPPEERALLSAAQLADGYRLSCRTLVTGPVEVTVPAASRAVGMRILPAGVRRKVALEPAIAKHAIQLTDQTLDTPHARLEHLRRCGDLRADLRADVALLRRLPEVLDEAEDVVTAVVRDRTLLDVEIGDTSSRCYGLALDLGTTTVAATLVDLASGRTAAHGVAPNSQATEGYDVISRINTTLEEADGLELLQRAAVDSLGQAISQVMERGDTDRRDIYEVCMVGNATMMHLCLGIPPASLGRLPYAALVGDAIEMTCGDLGLEMLPATPVHVLPNIAGYVGADTVAAVLAAGFDDDDGRIRVLADIGTNCELALRCGERLLVASTPAGPAFEGARISCGMYAVPGAIESVRFAWGGHNGSGEAADDLMCKLIGDGGEALGLCGSGLVDAAAELVRTGVVDETGRLLDANEMPAELPHALRARVVQGDSGLSFALAHRNGEATVVLTQRDLRELQLAKAAIRSGIDLLLEAGGVRPEDVDEFCIAGGFGNYLNRDNALRLGLIPPLPAERVRYIGNGALVGATLALVSTTLRRRAGVVARRAEHLQIAGTADFQSRFSDAMMFDPYSPV